MLDRALGITMLFDQHQLGMATERRRGFRLLVAQGRQEPGHRRVRLRRMGQIGRVSAAWDEYELGPNASASAVPLASVDRSILVAVDNDCRDGDLSQAGRHVILPADQRVEGLAHPLDRLRPPLVLPGGRALPAGAEDDRRDDVEAVPCGGPSSPPHSSSSCVGSDLRVLHTGLGIEQQRNARTRSG